MEGKSLVELLDENGWEKFSYRYIFFGIVSDILKSIDGGSITAPFTLSFNCIDYISHLNPAQLKNTDNHPEDYKCFVRNYMGRFNSEYENKADQLYAARCSFVHTHGKSDKTTKAKIFLSLDYKDCSAHLKEDTNVRFSDDRNKFTINLPSLVTDLICGIELFFREVQDLSLLAVNINKLLILNEYYKVLQQFQLEYIINNNRKLLKEHHKILGLLDRDDDLEIIRKDVLNCVYTSVQENIVKRNG